MRLIDIVSGMRRHFGLRFRSGVHTDRRHRRVLHPSKLTVDGEMADQADDLGVPIKPVRPPVQPLVPPRVTDFSRLGNDARPETASSLPAPRTEQIERRNMIVGREISLSGDISSCDRLVVEGSVEANLHECREMNIAESGLFKGNASIEQAEVHGRFEGELVVRKRLLIHATGHVSGTIAYGELEIECGGKISGNIQAHQEDSTTSYLGRVRTG